MYPPSPFAHPVSSFQFPVDPPTVDPTEDPVKQVCINVNWLPFIAGALKQLLLQSTWRDLSNTDLQLIQSRTFDLISLFQDNERGCGSFVPGIGCFGGDYKDELYGSSVGPFFACSAVHDDVVGWTSCDNISPATTVLDVQVDLPVSTFIRSFTITGTASIVPTYAVEIDYFLDGVSVATDNFPLQANPAYSLESTPNVQANRINITILPITPTTGLEYTLQSFDLCYTGDFPFSSAPDTWFHLFDFSIGAEGWSCETFSGFYPCCSLSGGAWRDAHSTSLNSDYTIIAIEPPTLIQVSSFAIDLAVGRTVGAIPGDEFVYIQFRDGSGSVIETVTPGSTYSGPSWHGDGNWTGVGKIIVGCGTQNNGSFPYCSQALSAVRLTGVGTDPFA